MVVASVDYNSLEQQQHEKCVVRRIRNNENSLSKWQNLHSFDVMILQLNMTRKNLQSINETLFKSIDKASTAIIFDLSINEISSIEIGTFEHFHNVRILIMRVNNLRQITSQSFKGLMMLEELYLSENAIFDVERDSFRIMENLHTIDLSENCLFRLSPFMFYRNLRLIRINFNDNYLNNLPRFLMPMSQYVDYLNVTGNLFTNMTSLMHYTNVQSLDLSNNPLSMEEMCRNITDDVGSGRDVGDESKKDVKDSASFSNSFSNESDDDDYTIVRSSSHTNHFRNNNNNNRRYVNDNFLQPDRRSKRSNAARTNIDLDRSNRKSEEALDFLIKISLNAEDEKEIHKVVSPLNRNHNRNIVNENFHEASEKINQRRRGVRNVQWQLSVDELKQLHEMRITQKMKYFTCRKCSLNSIAFLVKFTKLKYVDVSDNMLKTIDSSQLAPLKHMEILIASDNKIENLKLNSMLQHWPEFRALFLNNNPDLSCDLVREMQNTAIYLHKMFIIEVNKCK